MVLLMNLANRTGRYVGPHISTLLSALERAGLLPTEEEAEVRPILACACHAGMRAAMCAWVAQAGTTHERQQGSKAGCPSCEVRMSRLRFRRLLPPTVGALLLLPCTAPPCLQDELQTGSVDGDPLARDDMEQD